MLYNTNNCNPTFGAKEMSFSELQMFYSILGEEKDEIDVQPVPDVTFHSSLFKMTLLSVMSSIYKAHVTTKVPLTKNTIPSLVLYLHMER